MEVQVAATGWGSVLQNREEAVLELRWNDKEPMSDGGFVATRWRGWRRPEVAPTRAAPAASKPPKLDPDVEALMDL